MALIAKMKWTTIFFQALAYSIIYKSDKKKYFKYITVPTINGKDELIINYLFL